jgi:hypothetical protein
MVLIAYSRKPDLAKPATTPTRSGTTSARQGFTLQQDSQSRTTLPTWTNYFYQPNTPAYLVASEAKQYTR